MLTEDAMANYTEALQRLREAHTKLRQGHYHTPLVLVSQVIEELPEDDLDLQAVQVALGACAIVALVLSATGAERPAWLNELLRAAGTAAKGAIAPPIDQIVQLKAFLRASLTPKPARSTPEPEPVRPSAAMAEERDHTTIAFLTSQITALPRGSGKQGMLIMRAEIYSRLGDWNAAIFDYEAAIAISTDSPQIFLKLAHAYEAAGDLASATFARRQAEALHHSSESP